MFNLYFAGSSHKDVNNYLVSKQTCRLLSYGIERKDILNFIKEPNRGPLLVDSGAFSVAHSGKSVNIDDYINFINENKTIENFIELDDIPFPVLNSETAKRSSENSWKNYLYMLERMDEPDKLLPVFHFGEPIEQLKRILNYKINGSHHIPFICLGGRHGLSEQSLTNYFKTLYRVIEDSNNPKVKVHILGVTIFSLLEKFPFYSADSTRHIKEAIYGTILTKPKGVINISTRNKKLNNYDGFSEEIKNIVLTNISKFGYNIEELRESEVKRILYNIDFSLDWCKNYTYKGPKSFKTFKTLF